MSRTYSRLGLVQIILSIILGGCGDTKEIMLFQEQVNPGSGQYVPNRISEVVIGNTSRAVTERDVDLFQNGQTLSFTFVASKGDLVTVDVGYSLHETKQRATCQFVVKRSSCIAEVTIGRSKLYCEDCTSPFD